jgi:hypothetical protein
MTDVRLLAVHKAISMGDVQRARKLLKTLAKDLPEKADVYYYGAFVASNARQAEQMLRRALSVDELHSGANRLDYILRTEGFDTLRITPPDEPRDSGVTITQTHKTLKTEDIVERQRAVNRRYRRGFFRNRRRSGWTFLGWLVLSLSSSWLVMLLLGIGSQFTSPVARLLGAPEPIQTIGGQPVTSYQNPATLSELPSSSSGEIERGEAGTTGDVMRAGALHEYTFEARQGEVLAVAVQFFSPFAENVVDNVAVKDPEGRAAGERCQRDFIIDEKTGVVFICRVDVSGDWLLRIYGREGESSGVYIVSAERLEGF